MTGSNGAEAGLIVGVFFFTYAGMALGRIPGLKIDRAGSALAIAALWLAFFGFMPLWP